MSFRRLFIAFGVLVLCTMGVLFAWYKSAAASLESGVVAASSRYPNVSIIKTPTLVGLTVTPTLPGNSAVAYLRAIKSYGDRRVPFLKNRRLNPYVNEPVISTSELDILIHSARMKDCDFITASKSGVEINKKFLKWDVPLGAALLSDRAYIAPTRLLIQAGLNEGKRLERAKKLSDAQEIFLSVLTFAERIAKDAGSLMDLQFGIECQIRALHYLDVFYKFTGQTAKRELVWKNGDSLKVCQKEIQTKYRALDDLEYAVYSFRSDPDPVWRAEAALAIRSGVVYHHVTWPTSSIIQRNLSDAVGPNQKNGQSALAVPVTTMKKSGSEQNSLNKDKGTGT